MANLFAYCATYPKDLKNAEDPIARANDRWLSKLDKDAGLSVAAWGNDGEFMGRSATYRSFVSSENIVEWKNTLRRKWFNKIIL